jgi:Flp pilus assembly protein TadG
MKRLYKKNARKRRLGATLLEAAITLPIFLLLVFGVLDLGIAVARYNTLAEAARTGARLAIVHGADAPSEMAAWDSSSAEEGIKSSIGDLMAAMGLGPDDYDVTVTYEQDADGNDMNAPGNVVTVAVSSDFSPVTYVIGDQQLTLTASSRMYISN